MIEQVKLGLGYVNYTSTSSLNTFNTISKNNEFEEEIKVPEGDDYRSQ